MPGEMLLLLETERANRYELLLLCMVDHIEFLEGFSFPSTSSMFIVRFRVTVSQLIVMFCRSIVLLFTRR